MKLRIEQLSEIPRTFEFEEQWDSFPALREISESGIYHFAGSVSVSVSAFKESNSYRVAGAVVLGTTLNCSRCLELFEFKLDSHFTILFQPAESHVTADEDEVELDEQDLVSTIFSGDEIDLLPELEEQLLLSLPLKPLCNEHCKGICPNCGAELNHTKCVCSINEPNFKFAALKDFKVQCK